MADKPIWGPSPAETLRPILRQATLTPGSPVRLTDEGKRVAQRSEGYAKILDAEGKYVRPFLLGLHVVDFEGLEVHLLRPEFEEVKTP